jgi:hypothetical protein
MQVGLGATHAGNVAYRTFDRRRVTFVGYLAVQHGDVILDRDVHSWDIELLLERSQTRTDSIGEYIISNIGIRRSAGQPVAGSVESSTGVAKPPAEDIDAVARRPRWSGGASDEGDGGERSGDRTDSEQNDTNGAFSHWSPPVRATPSSLLDANPDDRGGDRIPFPFATRLTAEVREVVYHA